jgi:protein SCO1/2
MKSWIAGLALVLATAGADLASATPGLSVYQLESGWTTQEGARIQLGHFKEHPVVLAMVYTGCRTACPLLISDLKEIEQRLSPRARELTRFVLVSFDSRNDTSSRLSGFAKEKALDPKRWTLLAGDPKGVRELAAVLGVQYREDSPGVFAHSNVITILDPAGVVRRQQTGLRGDPSESVRAIEEMTAPK